MSLVKSPLLTPAKLSANRANARRSTGPRTPAGKRRVVLNALKHGRYSRAFAATLTKAGADLDLFHWIHARVQECFGPAEGKQRERAECSARQVWCHAWRAQRAHRLAHAKRARTSPPLETPQSLCRTDPWGLPRRPTKAPDRVSLWSLAWTPWRRGGLETKPRYALKSTDSAVTALFRIRIQSLRTGRRLAFWVRRRRGTIPPRPPVPAYPDIAAWLLQQQEELAAAP